MSDRDPMIHIRLPETMRRKLQASANEASRTMTAEVIYRLDYTLALDELWTEDQKAQANAETLKKAKHRFTGYVAEIDNLMNILPSIPKIARGSIIKRLWELEQERNKLEEFIIEYEPGFRFIPD